MNLNPKQFKILEWLNRNSEHRVSVIAPFREGRGDRAHYFLDAAPVDDLGDDIEALIDNLVLMPTFKDIVNPLSRERVWYSLNSMALWNEDKADVPSEIWTVKFWYSVHTARSCRGVFYSKPMPSQSQALSFVDTLERKKQGYRLKAVVHYRNFLSLLVR